MKNIAINTPKRINRHAPKIPPMKIGRLSNDERDGKSSCLVSTKRCKL